LLLTTALIAGHIFMAVVNPSTRHALRGMTLGGVNREWARPPPPALGGGDRGHTIAAFLALAVGAGALAAAMPAHRAARLDVLEALHYG
jgi:hypothetical protein